MKTKLKPILLLCALSVGFAAKRLGIRASVYLLAYFTALNVFAQQSLFVNGTAYPAESGATYTATNASYTALQITGSLGSYSGTNITLSSTFNMGVGRYGAYVYNQGTLTLTGGTITTSGTSGFGLFTDRAADLVLNDVRIETSGYAAQGMRLLGTQTSGTNLIVRTSGDGSSYAVTVGTSGTADFYNLDILTTGSLSVGLYVASDSVVKVERLKVETSGDGTAVAIWANPSGTFFASEVTATTSGSGAHGITVQTGFGSINNGSVRTSGEKAFGAMLGSHGEASLYLTNVSLETAGAGADGIFTASGSNVLRTVVIDGGSVNSQQASALAVNGANSVMTSADLLATYSGTYDITIKGGASFTGQTAALDLTSIRTGTDASGNLVEVDMATTVILKVEAASTVNGDVNTAGSTDTAIELNDGSSLTGNITGSGSTTTTISGSNGATITGAVSGTDNAILDITVSGSNGSLIGDITQSGSAAVTVTLDDHATGTGAFNNGNLNTNTGGKWTFTDDSHVNNSDNQGTINIGDHEVTFDHLTNDGTININLNNDTGEGGSITISDTASGTGTIHINATGDGQADPNQVLPGVLPGVVTGDGTEHWQWDPIDWGLDTIIKDGDHFIKQGTSPAGAVLNSAIAVQQSLWFAQQNSLLKRMGELRYGARASRPLADKDVRVPDNSLIDNIWLRSYGQQLNVGSQVAGKAYEQLIYGVDLGTDHKFTLSADSDLYLGVYAGYGRSDLDYRTPGADGEINSYYGGLYATWLHASGFYLDATVKAASVDNNLKAPHGDTQLKANYSDVNLGGSLELGKKFTFADAWFIEPQFQVNYLHILAENYTAGPMTISAQDLDALQL
ncbi:MAG: autotransporter outer membrane beta-barrel domain-containing protein, partial [Verrucomicrobiales bacterium]|nr:autotransporter outer membrane beta-barrel domain-containing protein [Verrucomicrobiales bacterium]